MTQLRSLFMVLIRLLLVISILLPTAYAQDDMAGANAQIDPDSIEAARRYLEASNFDQQMSDMLPKMIKQVISASFNHALQMDGLSSQEQEKARQFLDLLINAISKKLLQTQNEFTELTVLAHARALTTSELNALTEFQQTSSGHKFNVTQYELTSELMPVILSGGQIPEAKPYDIQKLDAINEMQKVTKYHQCFDLIIDSIAQQASQSDLLSEMTEEEIAFMNVYRKNIVEKYRTQVTKIKKYMASVYGNGLEIEDMKTVSAFFRTDVGQQIVLSMPKLFEEQQRLEQKQYNRIFADMENIIQETLEKHKSQQ